MKKALTNKKNKNPVRYMTYFLFIETTLFNWFVYSPNRREW
jgi:hypothetical protein